MADQPIKLIRKWMFGVTSVNDETNGLREVYHLKQLKLCLARVGVGCVNFENSMFLLTNHDCSIMQCAIIAEVLCVVQCYSHIRHTGVVALLAFWWR